MKLNASACLCDDGSLLIEFYGKDRRVGISLEPNQSESGWYYVAKKTMLDKSTCGTLRDLKPATLAAFLAKISDDK